MAFKIKTILEPPIFDLFFGGGGGVPHPTSEETSFLTIFYDIRIQIRIIQLLNYLFIWAQIKRNIGLKDDKRNSKI